MAAISNFDKRSYTWWWNSHISPKNSKWLQENLSDMDSKVKQMIKVIEEDADSFARRAEMYYKRRPELLKLVEEFYRAYRALAEKYDNATGIIRQAHRSMAEAFPDHIPSLLGDDALAGDATSEGEPRTPETLHPSRALFDPEEVFKDDAGLPQFHVKKTGAFTNEPDSVASKKGLKQLNELFGSREAEPGRAKFGEGRIRKELNFHESEEKDKIVGGRVLPKSEQVIRLEADMKLLKESLAKVEAEKEADLLKYQQSLDRLSNLESEVIRAKEDSRHLNECASKAEIEVQTLKETLANFNVEKETSLLKYEQCLERISNLEKNLSCAQEDAGELNRRTHEAETEAQALKEELTLVKSQKEAIFVQHKQSLEVISHLKNDLICAEENARIVSEKADTAAKEIEKLKKDITRLTEENEALALQYQHCLVIISNLESKISSAVEEIQRLNGEIDVGLAKLRGAEDRCLSLERTNQSLQAEKELLELKMGSQDQELTNKQQELAGLWNCIQEERLRFVEAETAFQTLQHLHSQSQEELKSLVSELQMKGQILEDLEIRNRVLQDDVLKTKKENNSLSVINLSSSASMKDMENELSELKETIAKLQEEVHLRVDQRNALQQEIYCLKEELNELNKKQSFIVEQVESVGLNPECIASRVKELQNDNLRLNDVFQIEKSEKEALLVKLEIMEKLLEKNAVLENSLADLNAELDGVREKVKSLEESCEMLMAEKSTLSSEKETLFAQLEMITENSHRLSEKSSLLESSLFDVNRELEGLRDKSNSLEHALQLVDREKDVLTTEKESLSSQLEIARQRLEDSESRWKELEGKCNDLKKERESFLCTVEELRRSLDVEKQEHARILDLCEAKVTTLESSLSDVNAELEGVTEKSQSTENSLQLLKNQKEDLIVERESLSSQLEITREKLEESERSIKDLEVKSNDFRMEKELLLSTIEKLRGSLDTEKQEHASILELHDAKFATLESSLRDVNCELEVLREKTQNLEHSLQVVDGEKDGLIIEKGSLSSLLEITQQKMEDLEKRCKELEGETNDLEKEKQSLLCTVEELRSSLVVEKQDHASVLELYGTGLASLQSQILLLQEEGWQGKKKYEEELDKTIRAQIEFFILQKGLLDMEGKCITQSVECQRFFKMSEQLELSVCQLEHQNLKREVEAKALLDQLKNVRRVMHQVALAFDIDVDTWVDDEILRDQTYLKKILDNLEDLRKSLTTALEENWQLMAEKSVLGTLLIQFRLEATELESIKRSLCEDLNVTTQKLLAVQSENHKLLEMNEGLRRVVVVGEKKEELSRNEIDSLQANLLELQGAHQILQRQNSAVIEEKQSLMKEVLNLGKEKNALADESILLLHETLCLSNLSLVFENFISEKAWVVQELGETVDRVCRVRNMLEMDVKVMLGKLDMTKAENLHLKDSLEKSETELETVRLISDQLKFDLANSNSLLLQKEMELSEAEKKLETALSEKLEFQKVLGDLTMEYEQLKVIKGNQEECISKLSEENERRRMETESLSEVISNLEAEMSVICRKHEETKISEQTLNSELHKGRNEFKLWENDAALLFSRLQISTVHEALFTDMAYELSKKCAILENSENSKAEEIYLLKEKIGSLEDKNGGLEAQMVSYVAGIESLKDCLNSLETHTLLQDKLQKAVDEEAKGVQSSSRIDADDGCEQTDNFDAKLPDGVSGLLELQSRIVAIEKAVDNLEKLQIKDLQSQIRSRGDFLSTGRYGSSRQDDGELPKDIMLDQISECSPLGVNEREAVEVNDLGLELWEATDGGIDQAKKQEICTDEIPSSEVVFEKELCVINKLEISKRFKEHSQNQEGSKTKILERLDSDSQKLTNLQIIVQDLKTKVKITEKSKKGKGIEYDTVREQLEEAEETIMKLFDMNSKLKKNIEEEFCSDDGKSGRSFDDTEGNRSKRVSEHARRGSEKIGRLQLEVQKLQFLLLKLDGRKESKGKTRMIERSPRVVLRDYLYGTKTHHNHKQKKARFFSCV